MELKAVFNTAEGTREAALKLQALRVTELTREPDSYLIKAVVDERNAALARSVIIGAGGILEAAGGSEESWFV